MEITTKNDAENLVEEIKKEECQPCFAFTGFVNDEVYNSLIYYENEKFKLVSMNTFDDSDQEDADREMTDDELADYLFEHKEDVNELLKNHQKVEWQERVRNRKSLRRAK